MAVNKGTMSSLQGSAIRAAAKMQPEHPIHFRFFVVAQHALLACNDFDILVFGQCRRRFSTSPSIFKRATLPKKH